MKHWLLAAALVCFGVHAHAAAYNTTCTVVTVSTSIPTELTYNVSTNTATNAPGSVWAVKVTNLDTTADLFSSQDPAVAASGAHLGEQIAHATNAPWNWLSWIINSARDWYVLSNGAAATKAEVCVTQ